MKLRNNFELKKVKSAGRALKTAGSKLPENRRIELEEVLKTYYSVQEVNRILYNVHVVYRIYLLFLVSSNCTVYM